MWDSSEGKFGFYGDGGATAQVEIDTDGSLVAGSGAIVLDEEGLTMTVSTLYPGLDVTQIKFGDVGYILVCEPAYAPYSYIRMQISITSADEGTSGEIGLLATSPGYNISDTAARVQLKSTNTGTNDDAELDLISYEDSDGNGVAYVKTYGGRHKEITRVTASTYTVLYTDHIIFANTDSNAITLSLPEGLDAMELRIVNTGTSNNNLTITPDGSENLLGSNSSFVLTDGESLIILYSNTDGWY
jgi:hypothetical protein